MIFFRTMYPSQQMLLIAQEFVQNLPVAVKTVKLSFLCVSSISFDLHATLSGYKEMNITTN